MPVDALREGAISMKTVNSFLYVVSIGLLLTVGVSSCRRNRAASAKPIEVTTSQAADNASGVADETIQNEANDLTVTIDATDVKKYDLPFREEIRRRYALKPRSNFRVFGLNGPVRVESTDEDTAEVLIVRSANRREDLQYNRIVIRHEDTKLRIYREDDHKSFFSAFKKVPEGRQRVIVRLPKRIDFIGRGINGEIDLGEIEGSLDISGVNGRLTVARQVGPVEVSGQNGEIDITFGKYTGSPIDMNGINGAITLRFEGEVNANLSARGNNGKVTSDLEGFEKRGDDESDGRYEARIGVGGSEIEFSGINGNIRLLKATGGVTGNGASRKQ